MLGTGPALGELTENQCSVMTLRQVGPLHNGGRRESSALFLGAWESVSYSQPSYGSGLLSVLSTAHASTPG